MDQLHELLRDLHEQTRDSRDSGHRLQAHHAAWTRELALGRTARALEHAERGAALYSETDHVGRRHLFGGHDPGVCSGAHACIAASIYTTCGAAFRRARLVSSRMISPPGRTGS